MSAPCPVVPAQESDACSLPKGLLAVPEEVLNRVQALYDVGQLLQAYAEATKAGPLHRWTGTSARILAGRLAANLGSHRLNRVHHWLAWRSEKTNPDVLAYHGYTILQRRGPLVALEFIERYCTPVDEGQDPKGLVHLCTLRALATGQLKDFTASEAWLKQAERLGCNDPWVQTVRASVLELQDQYEASLEAARAAVARRPWYRPGVQAVAHALQLLDRDEEALEFLSEAVRHIENMHVVRQLSALQQELRQYAEASASLRRFAQLAPLMEKLDRLWLERQQVTLDCLRGDTAAAAASARQIDEPYFQDLAKRLESGASYRRVFLDVPFVRQHHMTCSPATLSALSRFWQRPADHLEVAEQICYDGTPAHSERNWAETHGWIAREFTLTWETATALLDRGVPFVLTTSGVTAGHLQAVAGYDEARETLWIRDPFLYSSHEFAIQPLLEAQRSTGPRAMALVPADRPDLLAGLTLPEAPLYDQLYQVERALALHRRADAAKVAGEMADTSPEHRLTLTAGRAIASYDGNFPALLDFLERLLKQFPQDGHLNLAKLGCLRDLARRNQRLELLERLCVRPGTDPVFWQQYSQELRADAREHRAAASWIDWALRYRPIDPALLSARADLLWDQLQFERAARYYRFAASLAERNGQFARTFFAAARHLRETEAALDFLKERQRRFSRKSVEPTIALAQALQQLGRLEEAFCVLDSALPNAPDPGLLRLFAADLKGRFSRFAEADKLLDEARNASPPAQWHRTAAVLAGYRSQKQVALDHWKEVLKIDPLAYEAIRAVAWLRAETEGRQAAREFLGELCERFPFSCPLLTLRIQWMSDEEASLAVPYLRQLLEVNPADAWGWRELAIKLSALGNQTEAENAVGEAIRLEPGHSSGYCVRGDLLRHAGRIIEARADYQEALRLEVDNDYALEKFVETAESLSERKAALAFVTGELRRQVIFRGALFAYQSAARGVLPAKEVLELLREAHKSRPDLWQAWSVLIGELVDNGQVEEARALSIESTERFPLIAQLWVVRARVEQARLKVPEEIAALQKALELSPGYVFAARQLAGIYERQNDLPRARVILEEAISTSPLDPLSHGCLAQTLWKAGLRDEAIAKAQHAVRLDPGYDWAWSTLRSWGEEHKQATPAADLARELTQTRAGETRSWLRLASCLAPEKDSAELFNALDRALALNPRCEDAYDQRARVLTQLNRFDEALAQCAPSLLQPVPIKLSIRAAWIEAQRGNLGKAIERATSALAEHPEYFAGWQLLAEWHVSNDDLMSAIPAAEKMVALAPLEALPLGYLGDLKLRLRDHAEAEVAFRRAFRLDPDYSYAGFQLFALQLEKRRLEAAEQTLNVLRRLGENHQTVGCAVELACAREEFTRAVELFETLCRAADAETWSIARAARGFDRARRQRMLDNRLEKLLTTTQSAALAPFWVDRCTQRGKWRLHRQFLELKADGQARRAAVFSYLDLLGDAFEKARTKGDIASQLSLRYNFWRLLRHHRAWLHADVQGWGKVGYVLTCIGRPRPVIEWLGDWKSRPEAESWMLYNLALMFQRTKRYEENREVIRVTVRMRHSKEVHDLLRLWAGFEEALLGNIAEAAEHLAALPAELSRSELAPLRSMTEILIQIRQPNGDRDAKKIKSRIRAGFGITRPPYCVRHVRDAYPRFLRVASSDVKGLALWGWLHCRGWVD